jgi:hypothetical protein
MASATIGTITMSAKNRRSRDRKLTARQRVPSANLPTEALTGATMNARGTIAQLGERLDRTQEVAGSSPASSTVGGPLLERVPPFRGTPGVSSRPPLEAIWKRMYRWASQYEGHELSDS